ncbi:GlxA family transcriptional regulator [Mycolicibacterium neworleansense]|uniref:AraC family transcriptional regulator n=1 Tax=Mycolicibacterium neworleansense TaxID=146018 RepID=A0A0H5RTC6_9MYCO|nr:helix-turn-helix domain-containing protein [Mycolicibacterium neworleansense]MCV7361402.1 DJ-1/PfpI family protein [Mycolicibacterium neworleansense]CRZ16752.1 AraC family transcriptional regulator [Mycolicibacterium neworleansense]
MGTKTVAALALDGVITYDLTCAVQMFRRGPDRTGAPRGFELVTCGVTPGPVETPDGFTLMVSHGLEALASADLVIVPGCVPRTGAPSDEVLAALVDAHQCGAVIASICVGAFVLAAAGLLDGRRATTHWEYCDDMRRLFPLVDLQPDALYIDDGDILTSAGLSAGMDLCLHLVRREMGAAAAADLARWNVMAPHRDGGQAQFIPPVRRPAGLEGLGPVLTWATQNLAEVGDVSTLAKASHLSLRTFNRRFGEQVGTTPKRWLDTQRVTRARELLEDTDLTMEAIAAQCGFGSVTAMRTQLRTTTATTPSAYRRAFRR